MNSPILPEPRIMEKHEASGFVLALLELPDLLVAKPYFVYMRATQVATGCIEVRTMDDFSTLTEARLHMNAMLDRYLPNRVRVALGTESS
ncbi:MAG: hypothetical protein LPK02_07165 [Rhodobacterales bacterium]|nr:hypothetical protein [Rhodobacterales bacterium]